MVFVIFAPTPLALAFAASLAYTVYPYSSISITMLTCSDLPLSPHPAADLLLRDVWKANQLAHARTPVLASGHAVLDAALPDGGWPRSVLAELLLGQNGVGEMQLVARAMATAPGRIALVAPPYIPQSAACTPWGIDPARLLWVRAQSATDALWSTEQILKNNCCTFVMLWQTNVRPEALRRLNLAAQSAETWLWLCRPIAQARDASPAPLRLALRPANGVVIVEVVKRRGPVLDAPLHIALPDLPSTHLAHDLLPHATPVVVPAFSQAATRSPAPVLG